MNFYLLFQQNLAQQNVAFVQVFFWYNNYPDNLHPYVIASLHPAFSFSNVHLYQIQDTAVTRGGFK